MNKKLIVVAIGAALTGSAFAQTSNVTLYGRINTAIESNSVGNGGSEVRMQSYSSRLGVRGVEDLGGGLNGVFGIETQLASDSGSGGLSTDLRNAYIGVDSKDMGRLTLGRLDAAVGLGSAPLYQQVTAVIDLVGYDTGAGQFINAAPAQGTAVNSVAGSRLAWATSAAAATNSQTINVQQRASNAISYGIKSGDFSVGTRLQMSGLDGGTGAAGTPTGAPAAQGENNARLFEIAGNYVSGPLTLGVGYETQSLGKAEELANAIRFDDRIQFTAGYTMGALKVGGLVARNSLEANSGTTLADKSGNEFALSGTYALDAKNSLVVNYGMRDRIAAPAAVAATATTAAIVAGQADNGERKQVAIGYRYDFTKRTQAYALFNRTDPNSNVSQDEIKSLIVGLRHNF